MSGSVVLQQMIVKINDLNERLAALERNGIHDAQRIAAIAAAGLGQMSGYGGVLGDGGPEAVADYVWQQAQLDWPRA